MAALLTATESTETLTEEALKKLKVPELKELCKTKKLPVSGTKPVLIARLLGQPAPIPAPSNKRKKDASRAETPVLSSAAAQDSTGSNSDGPNSNVTNTISQANASISAAKAKVPKGKAKAKANESSAVQTGQKGDDNDQANTAAPLATQPAKKKAKVSSGPAGIPDVQNAPQKKQAIVSQNTIATTSGIAALTASAAQRAIPSTNPTSTVAARNVLLRTSSSSPSAVTPRPVVAKPPAAAPAPTEAVPPARLVPGKRAIPAFAALKPIATDVGADAAPSSRPRGPNAPLSHTLSKTSFHTAKAGRNSDSHIPPRSRTKAFKALVPRKDSIAHEIAANRSYSTSLLAGTASTTCDTELLLQSYSWMALLLGSQSLSSFLSKSIMDDGKRLQVALSYLLTKLYTLIGIAEDLAGLESALKSVAPITNIDSCTEDVSLVKCSDGCIHHVLNASGEVIGTQWNEAPASIETQAGSNAELVIRPDWKAYLDEKGQSSTSHSIFSLVRSPDEESFDHGISKHWLGMLENKHHSQEASSLLAAARAYVLCHVAPNAVSGSCQTLSEQQAEFSGLGGASTAAKVRKPKVSPFLPICHQVESVSFKGLHPCIALIQTSSRAHYTLRLTGQSIGEEDEGVLPIFQDMIKCDSRGRPL